MGITVFEGKSVNAVWTQAFEALEAQAKEGFQDASRDGNVVGEIINAAFFVEDPSRNVVTSPIRKMPMRYAVAELAWYLSGSNRVRDIGPFASKWIDISDDGIHNNSAYGYRIQHLFGFDQWDYVKDMLTKSPGSRQAIIHIKDASDKPTKDVPCTVYLQFLIRDNKLHLSVHMRSNDIWMGVPYDMFSFTFLQMKMAMELGVDLGNYTHFAGSLHMYKRDYEEALRNMPKGGEG